MQVKLFAALSCGKLEKQINEFLGECAWQIIDVKFSSSSNGYCAMVLYKA